MRDYNLTLPEFETYRCLYCDEEVNDDMRCETCKIFYMLDDDGNLFEMNDMEL